MITYARQLRLGVCLLVLLALGLAATKAQAQNLSPQLPQEWIRAQEPISAVQVNASAGLFSSSGIKDPGDLATSWQKLPNGLLRDQKAISLLPMKLTASFEEEAGEEHSPGRDATGSLPQSQTQTQQSHRGGLVRRSVKRTMEDMKELYLSPFKPANFKWDALELGGTGALLAYDRHIERHIGTDHYTFYQTTSNVAIASLSATAGAVWIWGIKGDHPHAKETGVLELETLVDTFLIYTPMQLVAARQRPGEGNGNGDFWKHHNINTSFPGGHAMFTFAMATVVSHEYPQKWVQTLAYLAATTVTVTRFMARDHWSSDMFIGTALGIGIGSHVFHAHCDPELSDSCKHHVRWIF
jgi:PAP2 superfamily